MDPNSAFEFGSVNIQSVLPAEVTYMSLQRPDRDDISTHNTLLDIVQFAFDSTGEYCNFLNQKINTKDILKLTDGKQVKT